MVFSFDDFFAEFFLFFSFFLFFKVDWDFLWLSIYQFPSAVLSRNSMIIEKKKCSCSIMLIVLINMYRSRNLRQRRVVFVFSRSCVLSTYCFGTHAERQRQREKWETCCCLCLTHERTHWHHLALRTEYKCLVRRSFRFSFDLDFDNDDSSVRYRNSFKNNSTRLKENRFFFSFSNFS